MPDNNQNSNQNNMNNERRNDTTFLPESPETPPFAPPPEMDVPAEMPGENETILPTPSLPSMPNRPGGGNGGNRPGNSGQRPPINVYPIPIIPRPPQNNQQPYCHIRFIHAAVGYGPVNIAIGTKPLAHSLVYGDVSSYFIENTGFRNVSVTDARLRSSVLTRDTFLFNEGGVYTIALVNSMNGISMFMISDMPCRNQRVNFSCVRAVNLSYNSPALDVTIQSTMTRFEDLRFKTVSSYQQVLRGQQEFYVSETESGVYVLDTTELIGSRNIYTLYILGDAYVYPGLMPVFTEDYSLIS